MEPLHPNQLQDVFSVPAEVAAFRGLSPGSKLCYGALAHFAQDRAFCWPSHKSLARMLGCSDTQVKRYLAALVKHKFIRVMRRQNASNRYVFLKHRAFLIRRLQPGVTSEPRVGTDVTPGGSTSGLRSSVVISYRDTATGESRGKATIPSGEVDRFEGCDDDGTAERREYVLSEADESSSSKVSADAEKKPTDAAQLVDLLTSATKGQYDRKVAHQIRAELARRKITVSEFVSDIIPHLRRLKTPPGAGFFLHHAQTFTPDRERAAAIAAQLAAAAAAIAEEEKTRCKLCAGGLVLKDPADAPAAGWDTITAHAYVDMHRAKFCACEQGQFWRAQVAERRREVERVMSSNTKPKESTKHAKR